MEITFTSRKILMILIGIFLIVSSVLNAQSNYSNVWSDVSESQIPTVGTRYIIPSEYRTLKLDLTEINSALTQVPKESNIRVNDSEFLLDLPQPDGSFKSFKVVESPVMAEALANKYPQIKTYLGQGTQDRTARVRFDITPEGFHAAIFSSNGTVYIDPYALGETRYYISYYKKEFHPTEEELQTECLLFGEDSEFGEQIRNLVANNPDVVIGPQLRTYRLACAATGEYTIFHGGTVTLGLAAVVTAINRVTGVYETEVGIIVQNDY